MKAVIAIIGMITVFVLMLTVGIIINSLMVYKFYNWLALPIFNGLPSITYMQAIGLSLLLSLFRNIPSMDEYYYKGNKIEKKTTWWTAVLFPIVVFGIGYIIHLIIM